MFVRTANHRGLLAARVRTCVLVIVGFCSWVSATPASADEITREPPFRLTGADSVVQFSAISADSQGGVHAFWAYHPDSVEPANALFYRYRNGDRWMEPTDIFIGGDSDVFSLPFVLCDETDRLHLIWNGLRGLYYSSAPAAEAFSVRSWSQPSLVVSADTLGYSSMVVDRDGIIHIVYSQRRAGANVMYARSEDSGLSWSDPLALSSLLPGDEQAPDSAAIAVDTQGILHVVWSENYPPEFIGRQVLYVQSLDQGQRWTDPRPLSGLAGSDQWNGLPDILVDSSDVLHVMWAGCGDPVSCCYRRSMDGGKSWAGIIRPFADLVGSSGRHALMADPYGNVYWAGSLRSPQAFYFSWLGKDAWYDPPQALVTFEADTGLAQGHFPEMALGEGNQLHVLLVEGDGGPLWYLHGQTSHPQAEPTLRVISTPQATLTSEPSPQPTVTVSVPTLRVTLDLASDEPAGTWKPLVWPVVAVLGLLVAVSFTCGRWKR